MSERVHELRGERAVASRGELSIDRDRARAKLRQFRLPDPHLYVLQFVRAASVLGASRVDFTVATNGTLCSFDAALPPGSLDRLWTAAYETRRGATQLALHNLALGIGSAQALGPAVVKVQSGAAALRLDGDDETLHDASPDHDPATTTIVVRERFRVGHLLEVFGVTNGVFPEERFLRDRCRYALLSITVNGRSIDAIPAESRYWRTTDEAQYLVAMTPAHDVFVTYLLRDGVAIHRQEHASLGFGAVAVMNSNVAQTDLSGLELREPPAGYPSGLFGLHHAAIRAALAAKPPSPMQLQAVLRGLGACLAGLGGGEADEESVRLLEHLRRAPIFLDACATGAHRSIADALRPDGVWYSTRRASALNLDFVVLFAPDADTLDAITSSGHPARDATLDLEKLERRHRNERRWRERPPRADARPHRDAEVVDVEGRRGAVRALPRAPTGEGRLYVAERLLRSESTSLPFELVVDGAVEADELFENVARDDAYDALAVAMIGAARRQFKRFVDVPERAAAIVSAVVEGRFEGELLGALGYGPEEAARLLVRCRPPRVEGAQALLAELGGLGDARIFDVYEGPRPTLREILESPVAPTLDDGNEVPPDLDRPLFLPSEGAHELLCLLRSDATPLTRSLRRQHASAMLRARPRFRLPASERPVHVHHLELGRTKVEMHLVEGRGREGMTVYFVYADRLLVSCDWAVPTPRLRPPTGQWHVVVRGDDLMPNDAFDDVLHDAHFAAVQRAIAKAVETALEDWRREVGRTRVLPDRAAELFTHVNLSIPHDDTMLAAYRADGDHWTSAVVDLDALRAATSGDILYATELPTADVDADVVLRLKASQVRVLAVRLPEHRLVCVDPRRASVAKRERAEKHASQPGKQTSEDLLTAVAAMLLAARGTRRDLLADFTLADLRWVTRDELCVARSGGVDVSRDHRLLRLVAVDDPVTVAFLASCVATAVNAHYREISDTDELELQRRLLTVVSRANRAHEDHA